MKRGLLLCLLAVLVIGAPISEGIAKERPHTVRQKVQVLSARQVSVNFKDKDLSEIMRFLTEYTGVNIIVSPVLTAQADDFDLTVTLRLNEVSVRQLLSIILDLKGLAAVHRHGVIMITTPKDARVGKAPPSSRWPLTRRVSKSTSSTVQVVSAPSTLI